MQTNPTAEEAEPARAREHHLLVELEAVVRTHARERRGGEEDGRLSFTLTACSSRLLVAGGERSR